MNEDLKYTLNTINDWLKFAEAKNAGLLALNIACVIGLMQGGAFFPDGLKFCQGIFIVLFSISSCFCLYSILPIVNKGFRFYKKKEEKDFMKMMPLLNALFFKDISTLSAAQFNHLFEYKHNCKLSAAEQDFGNQITNNAEICVQKYALFTFATWFTFGGFAMSIVLVVFNAF